MTQLAQCRPAAAADRAPTSDGLDVLHLALRRRDSLTVRPKAPHMQWDGLAHKARHLVGAVPGRDATRQVGAVAEKNLRHPR